MIICSRCGKENQDQYKFCLGCGTKLQPVSVPAPVRAPAPAPSAPAPSLPPKVTLESLDLGVAKTALPPPPGDGFVGMVLPFSAAKPGPAGKPAEIPASSSPDAGHAGQVATPYTPAGGHPEPAAPFAPAQVMPAAAQQGAFGRISPTARPGAAAPAATASAPAQPGPAASFTPTSPPTSWRPGGSSPPAGTQAPAPGQPHAGHPGTVARQGAPWQAAGAPASSAPLMPQTSPPPASAPAQAPDAAPVARSAPAPAPSAASEATGSVPCPQCGRPVAANFAFCGECGHRMRAAPGAVAEPARARPAPEPARVAPRGHLTLIRPDGTEGGVHPLREGDNLIGRGQGPLFDADPYLSPRHGSFVLGATGLEVRDLHSLNGVFVKLTHEQQLESGDAFRIGQELLRFDVITPPAPLEDGTVIVGTPNPGYWGRLSVIVARDMDGPAFPLFDEAVVLGRERGDILFPEDGYVSGTHAQISLLEGHAYLADLGSSNGTFFRIRDRTAVPSGSLLLMGQQLFRIAYN